MIRKIGKRVVSFASIGVPFAAVGVLGAISGTAWAGYRFVTGSPRFAIDQIAIAGNHHLTEAQVRALLPIHPGDNVFATSLDVVVGALRANPWIARADAQRVLPHTVTIDLVEHEPALVVDLQGRDLVDASGHPFKRAAAGEGDGLPVVTGLDRTAYLADPQGTAAAITGVLAALAEWRRGARPAVDEVHVDPHGALALHAGATAIQLGVPGADLAARLRTFDAAWADLSDDERARARAIHLDTRTDHVTVAFAQKDQ